MTSRIEKALKAEYLLNCTQKGSGRVWLTLHRGVHVFARVAAEPACQVSLQIVSTTLYSCKTHRRVIDIFDDDGNGEVDFKEFIMGLSHFRFELNNFLSASVSL